MKFKYDIGQLVRFKYLNQYEYVGRIIKLRTESTEIIKNPYLVKIIEKLCIFYYNFDDCVIVNESEIIEVLDTPEPPILVRTSNEYLRRLDPDL